MSPIPLEAFLEQYWKDREAGAVRDLAEYLNQFRGASDAIAAEFLSLQRGAVPEPEDGSRLGPYRLIREIGRGGQAVVWLAEDTRLGRRVALKVMTGLGPGAKGQLARFKREAAVASKLEHPAICGVHDAGIENGIPYIAMRYVPGATLADHLAKQSATTLGAPNSFLITDAEEQPSKTRSAMTRDNSNDPSELARIVAIFETIAHGLHAAHESGIVHRDIKPGNIMITPTGEAVLLDFGLARDDSDGSGPSLTQTGDLFGTPAYMSPEQITGRRVKIDRRSDIYSLGVTLYECLTLKRPFEAPTRDALYQAILSKEPENPRRLNRAISRDLEVVLQCAMSKDRDRRYQTAAGLAEDLRRVRAGEPIAARKVSLLGRAWRWSKRRPAAAVLLLALALGIPTISGLGVWWWRHRDDVQAHETTRALELVEDQLEAGFFEMYHGLATKAVAAFQQALRLDPRSVEAWAGLALTRMTQRQPDAALLAIEEGQQRIDDPRMLLRTKAEILGRSGRRTEALELLERAPKVEGTLLWFLEGARELDRGHRLSLTAARPVFERSAALLTRAVQSSLRPRRAYQYALAHAIGYIGNAPASESVADVIEHLWPNSSAGLCWSSYATLRTDLERSIAAARKAVALDPKYVPTYHFLALALTRKGALEEAVAVHRQAIQLLPNIAICHDNLGVALVTQGKIEEAIAAFREAIRIDPNAVQTHINLGDALERQRKFSQALSEFNEAVRIAPGAPDPHLRLGTLLCDRLARYGEAETAFRTVIRLDPADDTGHHNLGIALGHQGRNDEAVAEYREAIRLAPDDPHAYLSLAGVLAGKLGLHDEAESAFRTALQVAPDDLNVQLRYGGFLCDDLGRHAEAEAAFRSAVKIDSNSASAHYCLGNALNHQGAYEEAVSEYREAIRIAPDETGAHLNLGGILCDRFGRYAEAEAVFREVIRLDPNDATAWFNLGYALSNLARSEEAVAAWREGIRLQPGTPEREKFEMLIEYQLAQDPAGGDQILRLQKLLRRDPDNANALNLLAWLMVDPKGDPKVRNPEEALHLVQRAAELTNRKDTATLDTLAVTHFALGNVKDSVQVQEELIALMAGKDLPGMTLADAKATLERYRKALRD